MKRDIEILRDILLECEKRPEPIVWVSDIDADEEGVYYGFGDAVRQEHFELLKEAGLVKEVFQSQSNEGPAKFGYRITWLGFDFLDAARSETLWARLKAEASKQGVTLTVQSAIAVMRSVATEILKVGMAQ